MGTVVNRQNELKKLKADSYDILVVGGGATGAGIALDATMRGFRVALVEKGDFSSGTSSRSTKLIHGGIRYLEAAFKHFDFSQISLVKEGLAERSILLNIAPHLVHPLPIVIPAYSWVSILYYLAGLKMYDFLSGKKSVGGARFISLNKIKDLFPKLSTGNLKGGVLYYDGQFDDARLNISVLLTASQKGATLSNYTEVTGFLKENGAIKKVEVKDVLTGEVFHVQAKVCVNATGPFADALRELDDPKVSKVIVGSIGSHLVLDQEYTPKGTGLLIPKTKDGRVLFVLPWQGSTLVGTTDIQSKISSNPQPSAAEVAYLLDHLKTHLGMEVKKDALKATWAGIRPLVSENDEGTTSKISRDFKILVSQSGLFSIVGGKWTSFRNMAEKLVDSLIEKGVLESMGPSISSTTPLFGAVGFTKDLASILCNRFGFESDIAEHLVDAYGVNSQSVGELAEKRGLKKRLVKGYPYIEAEVVYVKEEEMAVNVEDVLLRRLRLGMLDERVAESVKKRVQELVFS